MTFDREAEQVSIKCAYAAMFAFLEIHYRRFESDEIGTILGEMLIEEGWGTMDPAVWKDWLACIDRAREGNVDLQSRLIK